MKNPPFDHVSASQIKNFSLCQRKWFIEKFCPSIPTPPATSAMELGTEVHEHIEKYLRKGEYPQILTSNYASRVVRFGAHPRARERSPHRA
jgi:CRISPR/Cas system-associated exonuclease Cas4 (RecB family)